MKTVESLSSLLLVLLVSSFASAQGQSLGLSLLTPSEVWAFDDIASLAAFNPLLVVGITPLSAAGQTAASVASGSGFVAIGTSLVALAAESAGENLFLSAQDFGSQFVLADVAYVPKTLRVVAVGVKIGQLLNEVTLFRSEDGGVTWTLGPTSTTTDTVSRRPGSVAFADTFGLFGLGGHLFASLDSGLSWATVYTSATAYVTKVAALSSRLALAFVTTEVVGSTAGLLSSDSGATWQTLALPQFSSRSAEVTGFAFVDDKTWLLCTSAGELWRTTDAAASWNLTDTARDVAWADVVYSSDWNAVVAVGGGGNNGSLAFSLDGGLTWNVPERQLNFSYVRAVVGMPHALPTPSATPSNSPTTSPSPPSTPSGTPSAPPTPSASPSYGSSPSASATPSASPSSHTVAPKDDDYSKLALGVGLGIGIGGAVLIAASLIGSLLYWRYRANRASDYRPINSDS